MKYAVGLGIVALSVSLVGCSGSSSTAPPGKGDAGATPDGGGEAGAGDASTGNLDSGSAGAPDSGGADAAGGEAGSGEAGDGNVPQVCQPGELSCAGALVQICNALGTGLLPEKTCSLSQTCIAGACLEIGCVPNTTFCSAGDVWACGPDGTTSTVTTHCSADQFCLENSGIATCNATACFGGDPMCDGTTATHCKPDGSGPKPGGDDCKALGQACYSGACRDLVCTPGQKLCDDNNVYLCAEAGTSRSLLSTCSAGQSCEQATGSCQAHICDPGTLGCQATRVAACNASGTAFIPSGTDCAATSSVCIAGACRPVVCNAGQYFCQGDTLSSCSTDGTSSTVYQQCSLYSDHCVSTGSSATCSYNVCTPSAVGCNSNVLSTCKSDGSGWASGGTDCAANDGICSNAKCAPKVCTPATQFCADGNVQACDYIGSSFTLNQFCAYGSYCKALGVTAGCAPTPCLPDTDGCAGEKLGHCSSDGQSVVAGAKDCGAAGQVCTLQGCAASATDTLSTANQVESSYAYTPMILDELSIESARKLTQIEMYLSLPASRTLTWVVYQQNAVSGYAVLDLKYEKVTSGTGTGFQSSGAMSLELAAGKTYAIGVSVSDGVFVDYFDTLVAPQSLNFAHAMGSAASSFGPIVNAYFYSTKLYNSRLTTTAP